MNNPKVRLFAEAALSVTCAALAALTTVWPDWIEGLFGFDPDGHSGETEWEIVFGFGIAAVIFAVIARIEWRNLRTRQSADSLSG